MQCVKRCLILIYVTLLLVFLVSCGCNHNWQAATCTEPRTCTLCGESEGDAAGHAEGNWVVAQEATAYQVGIREQKCTSCGEVLHSEEFCADPVFYTSDLGMSADEFITVFNKLADGDYVIKPDGSDYVVHWLGTLDISTSISFALIVCDELQSAIRWSKIKRGNNERVDVNVHLVALSELHKRIKAGARIIAITSTPKTVREEFENKYVDRLLCEGWEKDSDERSDLRGV